MNKLGEMGRIAARADQAAKRYPKGYVNSASCPHKKKLTKYRDWQIRLSLREPELDRPYVPSYPVRYTTP